MLRDAKDISAGSTVDADVCVVGSGPAGLALALALARNGRRVLLLESGGLGPDHAADELGRPEQGIWLDLGEDCLRRQAGGTSNAWGVQTEHTRHGVRLLRMNEADFEPRPLTPEGWPIRRDELLPFYDAAWDFFGLEPLDEGSLRYDTGSAPRMALDPERVQTKLFRFGDGRLVFERRLREAASSDNVELLVNATALRLAPEATQARVAHVLVAAAPGHVFGVRAREVVLTAGGLATTQLLLRAAAASGGRLVGPPDVLGRYYMDHPLIDGGDFHPSSRELFERTSLYDLRTRDGASIMGHLQLSEQVLRSEPVANVSMLLFPRARGYRASRVLSRRKQRAVDAWHRVRFRRDVATLARSALPLVLGADEIGPRALNAVRQADARLDRGGWSARLRPSRRYESFQVLHQCEQLPHADNRVMLGNERDAHGEQRLTIDWRWHDSDASAVARAQQIYVSELARAGLGRFTPLRVEGKPSLLRASTAHFMGTARMHDDPRQGVVDRGCKVHGVENLYVASTCVFPTGGFANPTLTVVAIALRIAELLSPL